MYDRFVPSSFASSDKFLPRLSRAFRLIISFLACSLPWLPSSLVGSLSLDRIIPFLFASS